MNNVQKMKMLLGRLRDAPVLTELDGKETPHILNDMVDALELLLESELEKQVAKKTPSPYDLSARAKWPRP